MAEAKQITLKDEPNEAIVLTSITRCVKRFWPKYQNGVIVRVIRVDWCPEHQLPFSFWITGARSHPRDYTGSATHAVAIQNGGSEREGEATSPLGKLDSRLTIQASPSRAGLGCVSGNRG